MTKETELAEHIGYMKGVLAASKKIGEVLDKIQMTDENFELRLEIRKAMTEMLSKSTE